MSDEELSSVKFIRKFEKLFMWVRWFYPKANDVPIQYLLYNFFPQKILRINGKVPWPVHFTSRILYYKKISIGRSCAPGLAGNCYIQARNGILIGHNLWTGPGVGMISSNHNMDDYLKHISSDPIIIGDNVWIGMNAVILPGIKIGNNVVLGANSVVTRNVPDNVIATGNPCRVIKAKAPYQGIKYNLE